MNESHYQNYQSQHYVHQSQQDQGAIERVFGPRVASFVTSPFFATGLLLLVGVGFAGMVLMSYPGADDRDVPVIEAQDFAAYKEMPGDPGGMDIPYQDSTVFMSLRDGQMAETVPIENLFADEPPIDRDAMIAQNMTEAEAIEPAAGLSRDVDRDVDNGADVIEQAAGVKVPERKPVAPSMDAQIDSANEPAAVSAVGDAAEEKPVAAMHKPGTSPETLNFVRGVLEQKDSKEKGNLSEALLNMDRSSGASEVSGAPAPQAAAKVAADIKPAAGFAISAGGKYVQLGSVKSESGAAQEWKVLQKKYPAELSAAKYRVQRADLGDRGVFYRIQAGPMSADSANTICGSIKAQTPGGCLVTQ
ncbi:MAG: SPOR domain-containing protein [Bdellovibrionales bacterium]